MGIINILDKHTANLIAAGEVVERPSSAIKEMLENCADAGATSITVEIKNGGTSFIRVTDNGKGMSKDDVPKCIMRHATSKIKDKSDLESIATFGFRGEALAAISSVSRLRILTRQEDSISGTLFECEFGEQTIFADAGCPKGTTIIVEDIFKNVPARRKFLKKDSTEAISVSAVCEKFALSRPDIALTFISDNNTKLQAPGDGNLNSAIYATLGRDFASKMIATSYTFSDIIVHGFIGKPEICRPNRNLQNFFVNNRYIRSKTMLAATEEAFRGFCPVGKFPSCVLFCDIDLRLVDVNVHPAKLEIKFSDEGKIFDAIYFAVKNALAGGATFKEFETPDVIIDIKESAVKAIPVDIKPTQKSFELTFEKPSVSCDTKSEALTETFSVPSSADETKKTPEKIENNTTEKSSLSVQEKKVCTTETAENFGNVVNAPVMHTDLSTESEKKTENDTKKDIKVPYLPQNQEQILPSTSLHKPLYIGEVFNTYIIAQYKTSLYLIDKHAAHERILYEKLKNPDYDHSSQYLLEPINVAVTAKETEAIVENKQYFNKIGFEFDEFGINTFILRALPLPIHLSSAKDVFTFLAGKLAEGNSRSAGEIFDKALFTAACRAAIKGGDHNTEIDNKLIIEQIFNNEAVLYCPHGRPVICELTKSKLEKMFGRQ